MTQLLTSPGPIGLVEPVSNNDLLNIQPNDSSIAELASRSYSFRIAYVPKLNEFRVFNPIQSEWGWESRADHQICNLIVEMLERIENVSKSAKPHVELADYEQLFKGDHKIAVLEERAKIAALKLEKDQERIKKLCCQYRNISRLRAVAERLSQNPTIRHDIEDWDNQPNLLLFSNGKKLDLKTGGMSTAAPGDRMTIEMGIKLDYYVRPTNVVAPHLAEMFPDPAILHYFRKCLFYTLLGGKSEKAWFVIYGPTNTGKTTLLQMIKSLMGEYGDLLTFASFEDTERAERRFDLASLKGKRFVMIDESGQDKILDAKRMKSITGGSEIRAEFKHRDPFLFTPQFAVWMATNFKPMLKGNDQAVWSRMRLFELKKQFPVDSTAHDELLSPVAIQDFLRWILDVREAYWSEGIQDLPETMKIGLARYQKEADWVSQWIEEELQELTPQEMEDAGEMKKGELLDDVFKNFQLWAKAANYRYVHNKGGFKRALQEHGIDISRRRRWKKGSENKKAYLHSWIIQPDSEIGIGT